MSSDHALINVLIVDDEKRACTNLKNLLAEYADTPINVAGVAYSTREAEEQIKKVSPDAIFLDIEMPNENAFQFLDRIAPFDFEVIFVTAYDEFAVKAFRLNAIDYILKPISIDELKSAVNRLSEKIRYKNIVQTSGTSYNELFEQINDKTSPGKICLKDANVIEVVDFKDILFLEANGSYSKIVFLKDNKQVELIMSSPLSDYEEILPHDQFYRIHRSYLINCMHVQKIIRDDTNSVVIKGNATLPISRRRFASLIDFLKSNHYYHE